MFCGALILFIAPPQAAGQGPDPQEPQTESVQALFSYDIAGPPGLVVKQRISPVYPPQAQLARIQATVSIDAAVDADGTVSSVRVISGHPLLARAAYDAVRQWKFDPNPQLPAHVTVRVDFRLAGTSSSANDRNYYPDWEAVLAPLSPDYPREAVLRGIGGQVALEVTIDSNRQISDLRVLKSDSGLLTSAAVRMIQTPRFPRVCPPPQPTPCTKRAVIDFELNQRDRSKDHVLFLAPKVVQAPPDLMITHPEVAIYPVDAHDLEGDLRIKLTVDQKGEVSDVEILSGPEPLAAAALKAAVKMRFAPPSTAPAEVILDYHF
jgi:TonB family protein